MGYLDAKRKRWVGGESEVEVESKVACAFWLFENVEWLSAKQIEEGEKKARSKAVERVPCVGSPFEEVVMERMRN